MGHKILLADDSITIQKVIELTFSDEDFELHTVGNGQKAIDEIRSIMPHIVLCDIIMPEKNGYEVCEFIKTSPDLKHIPVLLLTGAFEPFDQERARSAGCDGFLAKPFEPQTLISKVKELLARAPAPAAAAPRAAAPPPAEAADERTVIMPPPSPTPMTPPAARSQKTASPAPPPPPAAEYGGLDDAFAIEAGERELMMEPGDHTVLLGGAASQGDATSSRADDIWGEVASPLPGGPEPVEQTFEEDSSTVFMAPPVAPSPPPPAYPANDYEMQYDAEDLDATWKMPAEGESEPSYAGFDEFAQPSPPGPPAAAPPPPIPEPVAYSMPPAPPAPPPPLEMPPPLTTAEPEPMSTPFEAYDPFVASATGQGGFEPVSPFDTEATLDPALAKDSGFDRIPASSFSSFEESPEPPANEIRRPAEPTPPVFHPEPEPFDEIDASGSMLPELEEPARVEPLPAAAPAPAPAAQLPVGDGAIDEALIDKVAQRVVDKLSARIIQEIAWEVVPDLAEGLIQKEIEALKAKLAKVSK